MVANHKFSNLDTKEKELSSEFINLTKQFFYFINESFILKRIIYFSIIFLFLIFLMNININICSI